VFGLTAILSDYDKNKPVFSAFSLSTSKLKELPASNQLYIMGENRNKPAKSSLKCENRSFKGGRRSLKNGLIAHYCYFSFNSRRLKRSVNEE